MIASEIPPQSSASSNSNKTFRSHSNNPKEQVIEEEEDSEDKDMGRLGQESAEARKDEETLDLIRQTVLGLDHLDLEHGIRYISYESELQMPSIMKLIQKDLSEPYSVYTYRYFIHNWPKLCFLALDGEEMVGAIVCKLDVHKQINRRGYIAMLAVDEKYRRKKIGSNLVLKSIKAMAMEDADEVSLSINLH
jgi:peptide alpha-N-acetyltransferase